MPSPAARRSKVHSAISKSSARPTSGRTEPPTSKLSQRPIQKPSKQITKGPRHVVHSDNEDHKNGRDSGRRQPPVTPPQTSDVELETDAEELEINIDDPRTHGGRHGKETPVSKRSKRKVEGRKAQEPPAKKSKRATSNDEDEDEDEDEDGDGNDRKWVSEYIMRIYADKCFRRAAVRRICHKLGRFYPRAVHLWAEADDVVWAGIEHAQRAET